MTFTVCSLLPPVAGEAQQEQFMLRIRPTRCHGDRVDKSRRIRMARMYAILAEQHGISVEVFRNVETASQWLDQFSRDDG